MVSLEELAAFVSASAFAAQKLMVFTLELSHHVGKLLVDQLLNVATSVTYAVHLVFTAVQIVLEDYSIFSLDLVERIFDFVTVLQCSIHSVLSFLQMFKIFFNIVGEVVVFISTGVGEAVQSIISFVVSCFVYFKTLFMLFGSTIWFCITSIPIIFVFCFSWLYSATINSLTELYCWCMNYLQEFCQHLYLFCLDFPSHSLYGYAVAILICSVLYVYGENLSGVFILVKNRLVLLLRRFSIFCYNLWTGRFLESQKAGQEIRKDVASVESDNESKVCVVCQDMERAVLLLPCRHMCLCEGCSEQLKKHHRLCPICRTIIRRTMKVYV